MKKIFTTAFILLSIITYAQVQSNSKVGINTETPEATLDINGNAKIAQVDEATSDISIMVVDSKGIVKKLPQKPANTTGTFTLNDKEINLNVGKDFLPILLGLDYDIESIYGSFNTRFILRDGIWYMLISSGVYTATPINYEIAWINNY